MVDFKKIGPWCNKARSVAISISNSAKEGDFDKIKEYTDAFDRLIAELQALMR